MNRFIVFMGAEGLRFKWLATRWNGDPAFLLELSPVLPMYKYFFPDLLRINIA
jgi:hypothetical protein